MFFHFLMFFEGVAKKNPSKSENQTVFFFFFISEKNNIIIFFPLFNVFLGGRQKNLKMSAGPKMSANEFSQFSVKKKL